jgi:hypothetical protein
MKNVFFIFLLVCACATSVFSQESEVHWSTLMADPAVNFYNVQASFEQYWTEHEVEKGKGFKQFKRWEHFVEPRVYPSGDRISVTAAWDAIENEDPRQTGTGNRVAGVWSYFGNTSIPNGGGAGRVNMIRTDPTNPNSYFACAPGGGLWKSDNQGVSWNLLNTDLLASIGVTDVAIDHTNSQTIYIATGDGDAGDTYSLGVLKSSDGGGTWDATGLNWDVTQTRRINRLVMHPADANLLIAATSNGIYKTVDGGTNWTMVQSGNFKDVQFNAGLATTLYAVGNSDDFFRSTDMGGTWTQITTGLPTSGVSRMALAVTPANDQFVYILAGSSSTQGFYGLYRSTDGGTTFSTMATTPNLLGWSNVGSDSGGQAWYDLTVAADPSNADVVYVGGVNIWKSTDGGSNWSCSGHWYGAAGLPYVHADQHGFYFIPGTSTLLVANDGGIFRTTNGGSSFSDLSSNLEVAQQYRLGVAQTNQNVVLTGWQDNGTNLKNGPTWSEVIGGDGFECIIDHTDEDIMYGALYYGRIFKSTAGGSGFSQIVGSGGAGIDANGAWLTPYVMHATDPEVLMVGKSTVYKSINGGANWTAMNSIAGGNINALALSTSNPNYVYCSKGSSLYRTTDGLNFTGLSGLPNQYITYIAIDPADETRVWVTLSGYTNNQKVYFSDDAGATWTNFSNGLPNIPANCIAYHVGTADALYLGTDAGVYYRDNSFSAWQPYKDGLPNVVVSELEIHYPSNTIVGSTYGRGLWHAPLFTLPAYDAGIVSIESPQGTICDPNFVPQITLANFGENDLTSVSIDYGVQGGTIYNYVWSGSLTTGQTALLSLPSINEGAGSFVFEANIVQVNGLPGDDSATNNQRLSSYYITGGNNFLNLNLLTDCWASETSWEIINDLGEVIYSESGYINDTNYDILTCLADGCFTLVVNDSYGDGLSGADTGGCGANGDFTLTDEFGNILATMAVANFGFQESHAFCIPFATIPGCMDPFADNYDSNANVDDGSCSYSCQLIDFHLLTDCWGGEVSWELTDDLGNILFSVPGGTYSSQTNFVESFCLANGCYTFTIFDSFGDGLSGIASGCAIDGDYYMEDNLGNIIFSMDVPNYGISASHNFCVQLGVQGCTDPAACNFDPLADVDDGSCILPDGCTNPSACNFDPTAVCDNGSCQIPDGCTNPSACNYDPTALCDNGSCQIPDGCTNPSACNYDPTAVCDNGSCLIPDGCTNPSACNFDPTAVCDNGSCLIPDGCTNPSACNFDPTAVCDNGSCLIPDGCMNPIACNYNASAQCDDGSCQLPDGCIDALACNYDPAASCDDGNCTYPSITYYADSDGDGFGDPETSLLACLAPANYVEDNTDCDDTNEFVYPGAQGTASGMDNDCNGTVEDDELSPCLGDFNNDGYINVADLLTMLAEFGCSGCMTDMDGDGVTDTADMLSFLSIFGTICP